MSKPDTHEGLEIYPWLEPHWSFFLRRVESDRLTHALLITGPAGCGKKALAEAMAARLLCTEARLQACGRCRSCALRAGGAHPDYFELQPEEDSEVIKVDQVRALLGKLGLTTSISAHKVAYIHPAECMNAAAANALLKSLEEPAGDTLLILVSSDPGSLPATIRSRCQAVNIGQPDAGTVRGWLRARTGRPAGQIDAALQAAGGSPLRAEGYLGSDELAAYEQVRQGLATLLRRPGSVSTVGDQWLQLDPSELWRWVSFLTAEAAKAVMLSLPLDWLPANICLQGRTLLGLQQQADTNRRLSATSLRRDLLLQAWLIKWAEQAIGHAQGGGRTR